MRIAEVTDDDLLEPVRPANQPGPAAGERDSLIATDREGNRYDGNIVADLIEYRELRGSSLRGAPLGVQEIARLSALETKMRKPASADDAASMLRLFYRYDCDFPARLLVSEAQAPVSVHVKDISAGGVKLMPVIRLEAGAAVALLVEMDDGQVSLPSRVAWMTDAAFGLMFAGAPQRTGGRR